MAWLRMLPCSEGRDATWRGGHIVLSSCTLPWRGSKHLRLSSWVPLSWASRSEHLLEGCPGNSVPGTSPSLSRPVTLLLLSEGPFSDAPAVCPLPSLYRIVSTMFWAARFSSLGSSSLPEEIPFSGNYFPLVAVKPFLTSQLLCVSLPTLAPFGLQQVLLCSQL